MIDSKDIRSIYIPEEELKDKGYTFQNNMIGCAQLSVLGHFNNCCSLEIYLISGARLLGGRCNNLNLAYLIKGLVEMFDVVEEDGYDFFKKFRVIPCQLVLYNDKIVGFGHFMKDKFVLIDDFMLLGKKEM